MLTPAFQKAAERLADLLLQPERLRADVVWGVALVPPVLAGVLFFRQPALVALAIGAAVGASVHGMAHFFRLRLVMSPVLSAVFAVGLCGAGSQASWLVAVASLAAVLELLRGMFAPRARLHAGLAAYSFLFLLSGGVMAVYRRPFNGAVFPEPIQQWSRYYGGSAHFLDVITLYVGNVAGPMFATSLLALTISTVWLWYARKIDVATVAAFALVGVLISVALRWDPVFQVASGPALYLATIGLADRRLQRDDRYFGPATGAVTALAGFGLRAVQVYVEGMLIAGFAVQAGLSVAEPLVGLARRKWRERATAPV